MKNGMKKKITFILLCILCFSFVFGDVQSNASNNQDSDSTTNLNVRGATIWPIQDLDVTDSKGNTLSEVKAGTAMVALGKEEDKLKVYYNNRVGYVESDYCMINLPEVLQEEMQYDITNSYSSIYKIHQEDIPDITGEVLYPDVKVGKEEYLVPLLFPVAEKLYEAEADAISQGYTLKIYDAYRPYEVSKYIYKTMISYLEENPDVQSMMCEVVKGVAYGPGNFLAKAISNHNYGVAVDITLVDLATGEELAAQSQMHELSTRSVLALNNDTADTLKEIMMSHGFGNLVSEWWHFEIKSARKTYAAFQVKPLE